MDKRAHHNALERKRRDHIKDSFTGLRDAIPTMKGGDKSSRAQILKKASEYIQVRPLKEGRLDLFCNLPYRSEKFSSELRFIAKNTGKAFSN